MSCLNQRKSCDLHIKESFDSKINKSGYDCKVDEARLSALQLWSFYFFNFYFFSFAAVGYLSIISRSPELNLLIKLGRVPRVCLSMRAEVKVKEGRGGAGRKEARLWEIRCDVCAESPFSHRTLQQQSCFESLWGHKESNCHKKVTNKVKIIVEKEQFPS